VLAGRFAYSQPFDDTWHRTPDLSHARRTLGYSPSMKLREGLGLTLAHYKKYLPADAKRAPETACSE
jgi:nucleoside-diphosphate-sugar epimerase